MNKQIVYPLEALSQTLNGQLLHAKNANAAVSVCIDSRTLQPGDWFICIRGEWTDGHLHLEQALDKGAAGAVVQPERIPENLHDREFPQIRVGVFSACAFVTILSFNEAVRTALLKGGFDTFSTVLNSQMMNVGMSGESYAMASIMSVVAMTVIGSTLIYSLIHAERLERLARAKAKPLLS